MVVVRAETGNEVSIVALEIHLTLQLIDERGPDTFTGADVSHATFEIPTPVFLRATKAAPQIGNVLSSRTVEREGCIVFIRKLRTAADR